MVVPEEHSSDRERRLDEAIAEYYQLAETGRAITDEELLARHPDLAGDLASFLADKAAFERRLGFSPPPSAAGSTPPHPPPTSPPPPAAADVETTLNMEDATLPAAKKPPRERRAQARAGPRRETAGEPPRGPTWIGLSAAVILAALAGLAGGLYYARTSTRTRSKAALNALNESQSLIQAEQARREADRAAAETRAHREVLKVLKETQQRLYRQQITLAQQAWQAGDLPRMKELLERCPPRERAWEWGYLHRLSQVGLKTISLPGTSAQAAFNPDGSQLAIAGDHLRGVLRGAEHRAGAEVLLLEPLSGKEIHRIHLAAGTFERMAFSPDGKRLALSVRRGSGPADGGQVHLYDPRTGKLERSLGEGAAVLALAFRPSEDFGFSILDFGFSQSKIQNPKSRIQAPNLAGQLRDGQWLAAGGQDHVVRLYDAGGKLLRELKGHHQPVLGLAFHPTRPLLASLTRSELKLWDPVAGREAFAPEARSVGGSSLDFSPDGRFLAVADSSRMVKVLDSRNGRLLHALAGHRGDITCVAFNPDGGSLASASRDRTIRVWNHLDGQLITVLRGNTGPINSISFAPDGRLLASSAILQESKGPHGEVKLLDATRDDQESLVLSRSATSAGGNSSGQAPAGFFHPDGGRFTTALISGALVTWNLRTGEELSRRDLGGPLDCAAFSEDHRRLAVSRGEPAQVRLYVAATGRPGLALESPAVNRRGLALSGDGRKLAACSGQGAKVWDTNTGKLLWALSGHDSMTTRLALSGDGRWLLTANAPVLPPDKKPATVKLWDLKTGKNLWSRAAEGTTVLATSPDNRWLLAAGKEETLLWNARSGKPEHTLRPPRPPNLAVFSHDGILVALAEPDGTILLHATATGQLLQRLLGHTRTLAGLTFSPDGRRLVSSETVGRGAGARKGAIRVWDVPSGHEMLSLNSGGNVQFSPDGQRIGCAGRGDELSILDATAPTAEESRDRLLAWTKDKRAWHEHRAEQAGAAGQPGTAIFHLTQLLHLAPKQAILYGRRGDARLMLGEVDQAIDDFTQAIRYGPEKGPSWYGRRGMALERAGRFAKAIDDLDESLRRGEPWTEPVLIARGRSFLGQNQPARAIDDFARAIAKGPRRRAAWSGRGEAFAVQGRWKESEQDFRRAIDLDPLSFDDQESRLVVLLAAGRLDEYRKALAKMIEEFGREERSNYSLPLARACVRIPKAVNVTTMLGLALKSEKEQPAEPAHRCCVGAALYRAGLYESALTRLLASRKAGKPRAATEFFLAMTYAALGRKADAAAALQRGVTITEEEERKKVLSWRQRLVRQALRQEAATAAR